MGRGDLLGRQSSSRAGLHTRAADDVPHFSEDASDSISPPSPPNHSPANSARSPSVDEVDEVIEVHRARTGRRVSVGEQSAKSLATLDSIDIIRGLKGNLNSSFGKGLDRAGGGNNKGDRTMRGGADGGGTGRQGSFRSLDSGSSKGSKGSSRSKGSKGSATGRNGNKRSKPSKVQADHVDMPHLDDVMRASQQASQRSNSSSGSGGSRPRSDGGGSDRDGGGRRSSSGGKKKSAIVVEDDDEGDDVPERRASALDRNQSKRGSFIFESLWGGGNPVLEDDVGNEAYDAYDAQQPGDRRQSNFHSDAGSSASDSNRTILFSRTMSGRIGFTRKSRMSRANIFDNGSRWEDENDPSGGWWGGRRRNNRCLAFLQGYCKWTLACAILSIAAAATVGALVVMVPIWMRGEERSESGMVGGVAYGGGGMGGKQDGGGIVEEGGIMLDNSGGSGPVETAAGGATDGTTDGAAGGAGPVIVPIPTDTSGQDEGATAENGAAQTTAQTATNAGNAGPTAPQQPAKTQELKTPPYDLSNTCSQSSMSAPGGYQHCLTACLPSRCCLVPANELYEVWTLHTWNDHLGNEPVASHSLSGFNTGHTNEVSIGDVIHSCFASNPDACVTYRNSCAILDKSVLLPPKPPLAGDVASMDDEGRMELAKRVNHACAGSGEKGSGNEYQECAKICEARECCFQAEEEDEAVGGAGLGEETVATTGGALDALPSPGSNAEDDDLYENDDLLRNDDLLMNGFIEDAQDFQDDDGLGLRAVNEQQLFMGHAPSPEPSAFTVFPTPMGSSYHPTREEDRITMRRLGEGPPKDGKNLRRRRLQDDENPELVHISIPGEEDFVYQVVEDPDGTGYFGDPYANNYDPQYGHYDVPGGEGKPQPGMVDPLEPPGGGGGGEDPLPFDQDGVVGKPVPTKAGNEAGVMGNCVDDPAMFCMTFAGCAPYFAR